MILALWDGRNMVSRDDWEIAELIWKTSCEVREFIIDRAHEIASDEIADDAAAGAQRAAAAHVARSQADARVEMLAKRIARKVHATGVVRRKDLKYVLAAHDRVLFDPAVTAAVMHGWIAWDGHYAQPVKGGRGWGDGTA